MSLSHLPWLDAATVEQLVPMPDAVDALEQALLAGLDPSTGPARSTVPLGHGHLLLMPAEVDQRAGVKVASVAPGNPAAGRPRIQAVYVLMDASTLTPLAVLDGTALTSLRTPALSAVAVRHLASPDAARLVVIGTGPQAWGHIEAVRSVRSLDHVTVVGRRPDAVRDLVDRTVAGGLGAGGAEVGGSAAREAFAVADVVVCATSAADPVLDADDVADHACVVAVGSHEPDRRELDGRLLGRSRVVVEDPATALREAGDVVQAVAEGALRPDELVPLADVVAGRKPLSGNRTRVFKSVGMAWEDLVVAATAHARHAAQAG